MNAGLANLDTLKTQLLAESVRSSTDYDTPLTAIGLGVAAAIEKYCNRKLARVEGDTCVFSADRDQFHLPRYPVESVSTVEMKSSQDAGWEDQGSLITNRNDETGLIWWGFTPGYWWSQLRVTYTAGYWWQTAEPADDDYDADTLPDGATALPADLKLAWLLQCEHIWSGRDKLGIGLVDKPSSQSQIQTLELTEAVKELLNPHRRFQLT